MIVNRHNELLAAALLDADLVALLDEVPNLESENEAEAVLDEPLFDSCPHCGRHALGKVVWCECCGWLDQVGAI